MIAEMEAEVRKRLEDNIYGVDNESLAKKLSEELLKRKARFPLRNHAQVVWPAVC